MINEVCFDVLRSFFEGGGVPCGVDGIFSGGTPNGLCFLSLSHGR